VAKWPADQAVIRQLSHVEQFVFGAQLRKISELTPLRSVPPKITESARRQLGVHNRMLNILVTQPTLYASRIMVLAGERETTAVAQHMAVRVDVELGPDVGALIEHQTTADSTEGTPKPMGSREAKLADTVVASR
jgi:hypothetical protein